MGHAYFCKLAELREKCVEIGKYLDFVFSEFMRLSQEDIMTKKRELSTYGTENVDEMFAECFAECNATTTPRPFAFSIISKAQEVIKKIGD